MDVQGSILTNKSLMQIVRERRYLVAAAGSWIVVFVLMFSVLIPRIQEMLTAKDTLDTKTDTYTKLLNKRNFLQNFQEEGFKKQDTRVSRILPSSKPFLTLLSALENLSQKHSVVFSGLDISPGPISSEEGQLAPQVEGQTAIGKSTKQSSDAMQTVDLEMRALGSAENLNAFLESLGTVAPALDVRTFSLTPKSVAQGAQNGVEQGAARIYEAKIKLSVMYAPLVALVETLKPLPALSADEQAYIDTDLAKYAVPELAPPALEAPTTQGRENPFSQ